MAVKQPLFLQPDHDLLRGFEARLHGSRVVEVDMLVYMTELMKRRLYAQAGFSSMFRWCVQHFHMSEDAAFKRIRAARVGQRFPIVFEMMADGRLHLTAVTLLSARLNEDNAAWLIPAAAGLTSNEVRDLLAQYWPAPPEPTVMRVASKKPNKPTSPTQQDGESSGTLAPKPVAPSGTADSGEAMVPLALDIGSSSAPPPPAPVADETHYSLHCTLDEETHALLERARELTTPGPDSEIVAVLKSALETHVRELERRKLGATDRPRAPRDSSSDSHIPAHVRREVRARDRHCCTYVSEDGVCCEERQGLEFDHVLPLAEGGKSTAENLRLRCRAHNQLAAEQWFGKAFMAGRREQAKQRSNGATSP